MGTSWLCFLNSGATSGQPKFNWVLICLDSFPQTVQLMTWMNSSRKWLTVISNWLYSKLYQHYHPQTSLPHVLNLSWWCSIQLRNIRVILETLVIHHHHPWYLIFKSLNSWSSAPSLHRQCPAQIAAFYHWNIQFAPLSPQATHLTLKSELFVIPWIILAIPLYLQNKPKLLSKYAPSSIQGSMHIQALPSSLVLSLFIYFEHFYCMLFLCFVHVCM